MFKGYLGVRFSIIFLQTLLSHKYLLTILYQIQSFRQSRGALGLASFKFGGNEKLLFYE